MYTLPALFASGIALIGTPRIVHAATVFALTAISVLARNARRRQEARLTLVILLRQHSG